MDPIEELQRLGGGHLLDDIYKSLVLVAEEVIETRKGGSITLTLKVAPAPGGEDRVVVSEDLKRKPPAKEPRGAIYFVIGDGLLHKSDPRQIVFEVRQAEAGQTELRVVDTPAPRVKEAN